MRVLHINAGNMYGGVETFLLAMARHGNVCPAMKSSFACCFEGRFSKELRQAGVPVHLLGPVRVSRPWTVWQSRRRLRELLDHSAADVVICHMPWNFAVFGPAVKAAGKPVVFWAHGLANGGGWLERWAQATQPDLVICNSQFTAASMPSLFSNVRLQTIYYPVVTQPAIVCDKALVRQSLGASPDAVLIVQVSRMEQWKGHSLHLRGLAKLRDLAGWQCCFVGGAQRAEEQEYETRLRQEAAHSGIADRVRFLGQRTDVDTILAVADIFCQPNLAPEPFGIVFIEALAAGLPVVTTRLGAAAEILTGNEGRLVPPDDTNALASCLKQLITQPESRRELGQLGPKRARALCDIATQINRIHETLVGLRNCRIAEAVAS